MVTWNQKPVRYQLATLTPGAFENYSQALTDQVWLSQLEIPQSSLDFLEALFIQELLMIA